MSKVLVAYASKHGATAEIATAVADEIGRHGVEVDCLPADVVTGVEGYDAVVIGSAVYMKRWQRSARKLLKHHSNELAERPLWIFSSGPVGEDADGRWSEPPGIVDLAEHLGVRAHVVFGGALPDEPTSFMQKVIMEGTPEDKRDLRNFPAIREWAAEIAETVSQEAPA